MVLLRLGTQCYYATVGSLQQNRLLTMQSDTEWEDVRKSSTSKLVLEQHGVRSGQKSQSLIKTLHLLPTCQVSL